MGAAMLRRGSRILPPVGLWENGWCPPRGGHGRYGSGNHGSRASAACAGCYRRGRDVVLPLAKAEAAKNLEQKGGDQNASKNEETTEIHGDVRKQPGQGQGEVPKQVGGKGVQPPVQKPTRRFRELVCIEAGGRNHLKKGLIR